MYREVENVEDRAQSVFRGAPSLDLLSSLGVAQARPNALPQPRAKSRIGWLGVETIDDAFVEVRRDRRLSAKKSGSTDDPPRYSFSTEPVVITKSEWTVSDGPGKLVSVLIAGAESRGRIVTDIDSVWQHVWDVEWPELAVIPDDDFIGIVLYFYTKPETDDFFSFYVDLYYAKPTGTAMPENPVVESDPTSPPPDLPVDPGTAGATSESVVVEGKSGASHSMNSVGSGSARGTSSSGGTDYGGDTSEEDAEYEEGERAHKEATEEDDDGDELLNDPPEDDPPENEKDDGDDPPEDDPPENEEDEEDGSDDEEGASSIFYENEVNNVFGREEVPEFAGAMGQEELRELVGEYLPDTEEVWADDYLVWRFVVNVRARYG